MEVALREFTTDDLELLTAWANRIQSDQYMSRYLPERKTSDLASGERSLLWYVIQVDREDFGSIWLEREHRSAEYILGILVGEENLFGKGIGERAIKLALSQGRKATPIEKVCLNVRLDNQRAIACYQKCGFEISGYGVKQGVDGGELPYARMEIHFDQGK